MRKPDRHWPSFPKRVRLLLCKWPQFPLGLQIKSPQQPTHDQSYLDVREIVADACSRTDRERLQRFFSVGREGSKRDRLV